MCRRGLPRPRCCEAHSSSLGPVVAADPLDILQVAVDAVVDGGVPIADGGCRERAVVRQAAGRGCKLALAGVAHRALRRPHRLKIKPEFLS